MPFPNLDFVVLDTETTGFVPRIHRVIEYAAAKISGGKLTEEYESLFFIDGEVPPHIEMLTRIKTLDLRGKPTFADKKAEIEKMFSPETIVVGQNIPFDIGMLKGEGFDLSGYQCIDTSMLASIAFPEFESYSLGYMSEILKLDHAPKHRALGDVRATVAILEKCIERLSMLPETSLVKIRELAARGPKGYRMLFDAIEGNGSSKPKWLKMPAPQTFKPERAIDLPLGQEPVGTVELIEESLDPAFIEEVLHAADKKKEKRNFIAVKNLEATVRRIDLPEGTSVLYAPHLLLNPESAATFLAQSTFTSDELLLAIKLFLYEPIKQDDLPLHGEEKHIWSGKLACNFESPCYIEQIAKLTHIVLVDHRQLLEHVEMKNLPPESTHIVFDDASMLEDTATRAFGWYAAIASLRKAAESDTVLTKFTDLLQLWIEKTRSGTDVRYLAVSDLSSAEAGGLKKQLDDILQGSVSTQVRTILEHIQKILDPMNLSGRITWIEVYQNGDQILQSVPSSIAVLLRDTLFSDFSVSLLIPPKSAEILGAILPRGLKTKVSALAEEAVQELSLKMPEKFDIDAFVKTATGKSVILLNSRRMIEELYIRHEESCEARGMKLFCQGLSGGQSRMQAEFSAVEGDAILIVTPWTYEGFELPPNTVDHLILHTLPFDHPSHAIIGKRAEQFANPFNEYSLPRVIHRVFRLLRTFARHKTEQGTVEILDARLRTKEYGKTIRRYLEQFAIADATDVTPAETVAVSPKPMKKAAKPKKKKAEEPPAEQQALF